MLTGEQKHRILRQYVAEESSQGLALPGQLDVKGLGCSFIGRGMGKEASRAKTSLKQSASTTKSSLNFVARGAMTTQIGTCGNLKAISRIDSNKIRSSTSQVQYAQTLDRAKEDKR